MRVFSPETECLPEDRSDRSACHSPPRLHRDSGRSSNGSPPKTPSELSGARCEIRAARAVQYPTPEGLEAAVAKWDGANREVTPFAFLWVLC